MTASFPSSLISYTSKADGVDYALASWANSLQNELIAIETALGQALPLAAGVSLNAETLSANKTLVDADKAIQSYTSSANRDVSLPAVATTNHAYIIINRTTAYTWTIKNSSAVVIGEVKPGMARMVVSDGVAWKLLGSDLVLSSILPTTANVSAAVGTLYVADISGLTADRNFLLPACVAGDRIQLKIATGDNAYELIIMGDTGISLEGLTATEWSRVFISGEFLEFYATATNTWRVTVDGRMPVKVSAYRNTTQTITTGTLTKVQINTEYFDIGDCFDTSNYYFVCRRAGKYAINGSAGIAITDQKVVNVYLDKNNGTILQQSLLYASTAGTVSIISQTSHTIALAVGDTMQLDVQHNLGSDGTLTGSNDGNYSKFNITEILP